MDEDNWTWGGLILKTAGVVAAVAAAPVVLPYLGNLISSLAPGMGGTASFAGNAASSIGSVVSNTGSMIGQAVAGISSFVAEKVFSASPATVAFLEKPINYGLGAGGAAQMSVLREAGGAIQTGISNIPSAVTNIADVVKNNKAVSATLAASGYAVGKMVSGNSNKYRSLVAATRSAGNQAGAGLY